MFSPDNVEMCSAQLSVTTSDQSLSWNYPIIGQPEVILSSFPNLHLTAKAKERTQERLVIMLQQNDGSVALRPITPGGDAITDVENGDLRNKYSFGLFFTNQEDNELLQSSTGMRLIRERLLDQGVELVFDVVFLPQRPFRLATDSKML